MLKRMIVMLVATIAIVAALGFVKFRQIQTAIALGAAMQEIHRIAQHRGVCEKGLEDRRDPGIQCQPPDALVLEEEVIELEAMAMPGLFAHVADLHALVGVEIVDDHARRPVRPRVRDRGLGGVGVRFGIEPRQHHMAIVLPLPNQRCVDFQPDLAQDLSVGAGAQSARPRSRIRG